MIKMGEIDSDKNVNNQKLAQSKNDSVLPFEVSTLNVNGKVAFLDSTVSSILGKHNYPVPVSRLVAEGILLTTLLGISLKSNGQMIMQTQTDGPVSLIVVNYRVPGTLRAYAKFDIDAVNKIVKEKKEYPRLSAELLGKGHLAMTIDHGEYSKRYQGLVALDGMTFEEAAHQYFEQSEQTPTCIKLSVGELIFPKKKNVKERLWTAGGIIIQSLPKDAILPQSGEKVNEGLKIDKQTLKNIEADAWVEVKALINTITDAELSLPDITAEQLLVRLFHQHELRVFPPHGVKNVCQCDRQSIKSMLEKFKKQERLEMIEDGKINVVCEFCNTKYEFKPVELENESET